MKLKEKPLLLVLGILFFAASAFVLADTAADETQVPNETKTPVFTDSAILVYFNLDDGEVEQTVLIGASVVNIGGAKFLTGTVTHHLPHVPNNFAEAPSFIAISRIVFIQQFGVPESGNSGESLNDLFR